MTKTIELPFCLVHAKPCLTGRFYSFHNLTYRENSFKLYYIPKIMRGKFSKFLGRRIGVVIVLTFTANMIMFSAIIAYTGSTSSEQHTDIFRKQKILQNNDLDKWKDKSTNTEHVKQIQAKENGQMDYIPSKRLKAGNSSEYIEESNRKLLNQSAVKPPKKPANLRKQAALELINALANAKSDKVYYMYDNNSPGEVVHRVQVMKSKDQLNGNQKAPNTFNAKYIEYFWRQNEFHNKQESVKVFKERPDDVKKVDTETGKDINRKQTNNVIENKTDKTATKQNSVKVFEERPDDVKKVETETGKDIHRKPTNKFTERKSDKTATEGTKETADYIEIQRKSKHFAILNDEQLSPNVSYITMFPAKGKLGNQMFQLASLLGIADSGNFTAFLPMSVFDLNKVFALPQGFSKDVDISFFDHFSEEDQSQNDSIILSRSLDKRRNWSLEGYFQSFKYFSNVGDKVKKYLLFHKYLLVRAVEFLQHTVPMGHVKVAIHIRRGDFISSYQRKLGRVAATTEYVQRAMQYFESRYKNITFIVVSDDIQWCRKNIKGDNVKYSTTPSNQKGLDLAIISRCDHVIISVGTFGWWGGWLSGGTVIYYNKFPTTGSELDKTFVPENYYPSQWIGLD